MSVKRYAAKRDSNETEIIAALHSVGASVAQISAKGLPDLLVGWRGKTFLMETKTRRGKLTPSQQQFIAAWDGAPVVVVRSIDDALKAIGAIGEG